MNQSKQNPVVVVMGAGNATGSAVARRFASKGYIACVSRRNEEKLQPLVQSIEEAGGQARAFGADARKEEQVQAMFRTVEEEIGPIEVCVFNVGGNVKFPPGGNHFTGLLQSLGDGLFCRISHRTRGGSLHETEGQGNDSFYRRHRIQARGLGVRCLQRGQILVFAPWPSPWCGNSAPWESMLPMSSSMGQSIPNGSRNSFQRPMPRKKMTESSTLRKLRKSIGNSISRNAVHGPRKWTSVPGWNPSDHQLGSLFSITFPFHSLQFLGSVISDPPYRSHKIYGIKYFPKEIQLRTFQNYKFSWLKK